LQKLFNVSEISPTNFLQDFSLCFACLQAIVKEHRRLSTSKTWTDPTTDKISH